MRAGRARRSGVRSLRTRLTGAAAIAIAVALVLAATLLTVRLHHGLVDSVDTTARQRLSDVAELVRSDRLPGRSPLGAEDEVISVRDARGEVLADTRPHPAAPDLLAAAPAGPRTVSGTAIGGDADSYRVATAVITTPRGPVHVAVAEASDDVSDSISQLVALLALGLPVVLALLVGLTWLLVGRALRPVETLRQQAEAISGDDLARRVDVPRSGDELARLADTLNGLLRRADAALDRERAFVADAAHELRTPLAAVLTRLEVGQRWPDGAPVDDVLPAQVRRMGRLVDDLLTLARVDARALALVAVDLDDVVLAELDDARSSARTRQPPIHMRPTLSAARVLGDGPTLRRAVRNLLDNAVRYASHTVSVSLEVRGDEAVLTVSDDGPGVDPSRSEEIFERFSRLEEGRGREAGGAGLGLAIVRTVIRAHRGCIELHHGSPGARFIVRLPVDRSS